MLLWHYRSRHPSLIEVSNDIFYGSNLLLPPAPTSTRDDDGLVLCRVDGAYDRGGKKTNATEAHAVVKALIEVASRFPKRSAGIVTFSTPQRDLITNLLEHARRKSPALDAYLDAMKDEKGEEVFVKNLENVQGDERDVIFLSIGYGPRIAGVALDSLNFGPVSKDGGERRLNVLFTRARHRCEVFVSFDSGDIDLSRTASRGAEVLKRFLAFAETGILDQPVGTGEDHDSPFEADVARVIGDLGYRVDAQVGSA